MNVWIGSFCVVVALAISTGSGFAQEEKSTTSTQVVNGTSVASLKVLSNGTVVLPEFPQGTQITGGPANSASWNYQVVPLSGGTPVAIDAKLQNLGSYVLGIIGDFKELEASKELEVLPGYTKVDGNKLVRVGGLLFPLQSRSGSSYPVRVVNAMVDVPLKVTFADGTVKTLTYGQNAEAKYTGEAVELTASATEYERKLKFYPEDDEAGIALFFFKDFETGKPKFATARLKTLASKAQ